MGRSTKKHNNQYDFDIYIYLHVLMYSVGACLSIISKSKERDKEIFGCLYNSMYVHIHFEERKKRRMSFHFNRLRFPLYCSNRTIWIEGVVREFVYERERKDCQVDVGYCLLA